VSSAGIVAAVKFYRIPNWLHFLGFPLLGVLLARPEDALPLAQTMLLVIASAGLLAYAYSLNDISDRELGRQYGISPKSLSTFGSKNIELSISIMPLLGSLILLAWFPFLVLALAILFAVLWTAYSFRYPRLKAVPGVCTLINGVGFPLLFLMGFASVRLPNAASALLFVTLVLLQIPAQLIHELCHSRDDRLVHVETTAVHFGVSGTLLGVMVSLSGALVTACYMLSQGIASAITAISMGSFATVSMLTLVIVRRRRDVLDFQSIRFAYRCGGIITGVVVAAGAILAL